tara:strand:+ start:932 stop:1267 length:336 start_codon:yes stop_codon:yes gene_type:complete
MGGCLEEATDAWSHHITEQPHTFSGHPVGGSEWEWDDGGDGEGFTATDKIVIATLAVALYAERMRREGMSSRELSVSSEQAGLDGGTCVGLIKQSISLGAKLSEERFDPNG